jgi:hypothetical protein
MRLTHAIFALGLPLLAAEGADAQSCTPISTVPFIITTSGNYCLTQNIQTPISSGAAIAVETDNVNIDLSGFTLENTAGVTTLAYGVRSWVRRGVTVRNGTIAGFYLGILIDTNDVTLSRDHVVEKVLVRNCTYTGIQMEGSNMILRDSTIKDIGGPTGHHPNGVVVCENGNFGSIQVINNVVDNVFGVIDEQSPDGMMLECHNTIAIGNRIRGIDDQAMAVRGGVCRDNVLQMVAQRPFEGVKGGAGCTLLGKSNFSFP